MQMYKGNVDKLEALEKDKHRLSLQALILEERLNDTTASRNASESTVQWLSRQVSWLKSLGACDARWRQNKHLPMKHCLYARACLIPKMLVMNECGMLFSLSIKLYARVAHLACLLFTS